MINELIKEKHDEIDREEEAKIFNAIHRQAKENYYFEKGKKYLKKKNKKLRIKKELKQQLINDTLCFTLAIATIIPYLLLLVVLHK